jgi:energy-coupling factor transporter ATP-binding protein EcfA2
MGILLIEHNVHLVLEVCDRITVLDFGRQIAAGTPTEIRMNPIVVGAYLGEDDEEEPKPRTGSRPVAPETCDEHEEVSP